MDKVSEVNHDGNRHLVPGLTDRSFSDAHKESKQAADTFKASLPTQEKGLRCGAASFVRQPALPLLPRAIAPLKNIV